MKVIGSNIWEDIYTYIYGYFTLLSDVVETFYYER